LLTSISWIGSAHLGDHRVLGLIHTRLRALIHPRAFHAAHYLRKEASNALYTTLRLIGAVCQ
jgi:hypothetical protein